MSRLKELLKRFDAVNRLSKKRLNAFYPIFEFLPTYHKIKINATDDFKRLLI